MGAVGWLVDTAFVATEFAVEGSDEDACVEGEGATAAAAAVAYLTGNRGGFVSSPFFNMLDMDFSPKFGCGGGFTAAHLRKHGLRSMQDAGCLLSDAIDGSNARAVNVSHKTRQMNTHFSFVVRH